MARKPKTGMLTGKATKSDPADGRYTSPGSALPPTGTTGIKGTAPTKSAPSNEMITSPGGPMTSSPETGGIKPMQDVKGDAPVSTTSTTTTSTPASTPTTFTFFEGAERGNASPTSLYGSREAEQVTEAELRAYFEGDTVNRLPEVFGTFDNYLAYMTEREQLIQSGDYDVGNWDEYTGSLTEDDLMILEGEDLTQYGDDASSTYEELYGERTQNQSAAYENWVNSEANQALLQKYGVNDTVYSETGDKFRWNGSAYVKTVNEDHAGLTDYVKMAMVTALTVGTGAAVAAAAPALGTVGSATLSNAITQAITTGSIDPDQLLQTAATAGLGQALSQVMSPEVLKNLNDQLGFNITAVTGIEEVDNVLNAMGMTALRQGVFEGSLDMDQIVASGLVTGVKEIASFITDSIKEALNSDISDEKMQERLDHMLEQTALVGEEVNEEVIRNFNNIQNSDLAQQQSEAMTASMQRIADNLNEMYASEPTPDFSVPGESTVDAAGSEFADTTAEDEGPIYEFSEDRPDTTPGYAADVSGLPSSQDYKLINGVYYNESGFPVGVSADATPEQILEQFVNDKNADFLSSGQGIHGLPEEAVAILMQEAEAGEGGLASLGSFLADRGLVLAQGEGGGYIIISGTNSETGFHSSLDLDALVSLDPPVEEDRFFTPPSQDASEQAMTPEESQAFLDQLREESFEPDTPLDIEEPEITFEAEEYEFEPEVIPDPVDPVDPVDPTDTTDTTDPGDAGVGTSAVDTVVGGMLTGQETPTDPAQPPSGDTTGGAAEGATGGAAEGATGGAAGADTTTDTTTPSYEQGSMIGDAEGLIELALQSGATTEYLLENYPQYTDLINEISGRTDTQETDAPIVEELFDDILGDAREDAAVADYTTAEEVANIVNQIVANTPNAETLTPEQVNGLVEQAISEIPQADSLTPEQVQAVVESATSNLQQGVGQQITDVETSLQEALAAQAQGQARALTDAEANLLSEITGVEAEVLQQLSTVEGALDTRLTDLGTDISGVQETVAGVVTGQTEAAEERRDLQQAIINVGGDIDALDEQTREQFDQFGQDVNDLFSDVNVDIEGLQEGQVSQAAAQAEFESSVAGQFEQVGGELTGIQSDISGLGQQVGGIGAGLEGIGEGIAGLGEGLGAGLMGLALQQQQLPEQIAAAMPRQPVKFDPFLKGLSPRKMPKPLKVQGMLV